jgi:ribose 5-phosphate isomerase A
MRTKEHAESLGIPLATLNEISKLDVAIDGADDVDPNLNLVKGGGGALLREKMVEIVSDKFICIVDDSKLSPWLGRRFPIPVEITPFCYEHTRRVLENLKSIKGCSARMRMGSAATIKPDGDNLAVTDNGNYIVDIYLSGPLSNVEEAAAEIKSTVGVVEHGLFVNMAHCVVIAGKSDIRVAGNDGEPAWWR